MSIYYNVVYQGKILEGFDFEAAKNKLIENFALSKEKAEKVLRSRRVVLKKTVDEMTARKLGSALKRVGLDVILTKGRTTAADQPVTVGSGPETGPRVDKIAATPAAALDRQSDIAASAAAVEQTPAPKMAVIPFEFRGSGREYFKIWLVNIILTILTLGIYSAWAKVRHKKYIYGSARLNGAGFEYLADPVKILKGRMIAAVFLVLYSILSNLFPQIGFIFSLVLFAAVPWIVVCALAFNARNSALRNIRFGFSGRIKDAAKTFVLWPILVPLTLGILAPYAYYRQRKFIVENSSYGTTRFAFSASARDYYRLFLSASVSLVIGVGFVAAVIFFLTPLSVPAALALYLYLFALYSVKTTNLQFNSSQLAEHRFKANLRVKEYLALVVTNSLATALTLGLFYPWAKIRTLRYKFSRLSLITSGDIDTFIAGEQKHVGSVGEEMSDFFDIDIGL
ncbi:MAG: YjgN family protein [Desulfobacterales bacterium]|jgi:uncharacterized membrane protein YjgN (DUF898 family)